jgi:cytochrome oxidase Cu insertion factor (SCO1/SenC/PrrC family)
MTPPLPEAPPPPHDTTTRRAGLPWFHLVFLALITATGLAGGLLMWLSAQRSRSGANSPPPTAAPAELPVYATIRHALTAPERSGRTVTTTELRGKVWVLGYTYTRCPRGCLGVIGTMLKLRDEFGANPRFHQVSVAVDPAHDTPEILKNFAAAAGIRDTDPWWFLSGDASPLREFVTHQIGFAQTLDVPPAERLSEFDLFAHDLRLALIDAQGRLRGYYEVQNEDGPTAEFHIERLRADIRRLVTEP